MKYCDYDPSYLRLYTIKYVTQGVTGKQMQTCKGV